jgi:hypothetical protein
MKVLNLLACVVLLLANTDFAQAQGTEYPPGPQNLPLNQATGTWSGGQLPDASKFGNAWLDTPRIDGKSVAQCAQEGPDELDPLTIPAITCEE